eukprot:GILK01009641.1.p1 GENE.GILK01009641.1~~GILK01009641.1.p1  ORF type:complete len:1297 (+),score=442.12 GILK01009641.1:527-3892(+)
MNQLKGVIRERDIQLKLVQVESAELRRMNQEAEESRMALKQLLREKERDVTKQLSVISADRNRFEDLVNNLQRQLQDMDEQNQRLQNGRLDIESDVQRVVVESNQKSVRIELLEEELGSCKSQLAELQNELDVLNRLNSQIKDNNEMLQTQLNEAGTERAQLESTCESRHIPQEGELRLMKEQMEEMLDAHKKLNVELADVTQERDEMLQSLKDHIQFDEEHEKDRDRLAEQIIAKEEENSRLEIALKDAQAQIDRLQSELSSSLQNRITGNETVLSKPVSIPATAATLPNEPTHESGAELPESTPVNMEVVHTVDPTVEPADEMVVESSLTQAPPEFMPTQIRFDDDSIPLPLESIPAESGVKSVQQQPVRRLEEVINDQLDVEPTAASTVESVHVTKTVTDSASNGQSPSMIPARRNSNPESSHVDSTSELISRLNERIEMLTKEKEEIKDRIELEYSTRFAILRSEYAEDNSQLKQLNDETVRLESALKDSLAVAKQLREKLEKSEEQIRNLEAVQQRIEKEKEELTEKAKSDHIELVEDLRMTKSAANQLTIELAAKSAAMQRVEQQHESDRKRFAELASQVTNSEVRLVEIEEERNQLFARLESERLTCEQLRTRVSTLEPLETDLAKKMNQIVELESELSRLRTKANAAEAVLVESGTESTEKSGEKVADRVLIQETQEQEPSHVTENESATGVRSDVNQDNISSLRQEIDRLAAELNQARTDLQQGHVHKSNLDRTQEMLNQVTRELESLRQAFQVQQTETLQLRQLQNRLRDVTRSISCQTGVEQPTESVSVRPDSAADSTTNATAAATVETAASSRPFTSLDVALARTRNQNLLDDSPHTVMRKVGAAAQNQPLPAAAKPLELTQSTVPSDVSVKMEMQTNRSVQRKRQVVVAFTGFKSPNPASPEYTEERKQELIRFVRELGGEVRLDASFDKQITHLVLPRSSRRSAKALAASLTGKWLVNSQWVTESFKAKQFIAESPFGDRYFERPFENKKVALSAKFIKESNRRAGSSDFDRHALVRILVEKFGRGSLVSEDHRDADILLVSTSELTSNSIQTSGQIMNFEAFIDLIPGAPEHTTSKNVKRKSQSADNGQTVKRLKSEPSDPSVPAS